MPAPRSTDTSPDLFSTAPGRVPEPPTGSGARVRSDDQVAPSGHVLPKDLAAALKRLRDADFAALLSAVTTEARRRNALAPASTTERLTADATAAHRPAPAHESASSLPTAKLNAVRAAFKAGVKPSTIARQFGISQSDVRKALSEGRTQKSGR